MGNTRFDEVEHQAGSEGNRRRDPTRGGVWNWFGVVFGVTVLIGGGILYLAAGTQPEPDVTETVASPAPTTLPVDERVEEAVGFEEVPVEHEAPVGHEAEAPAAGDTALPAEPGDTGVVEIEMFEFGYTPSTIDIQAGVPVVFRFNNSGRLPHEAMVGDAHMQEEFAGAGDHDHGDRDAGHHGELMAILLQPGETGDLEVRIDEPGTWYFGCHLIGHYEQGQVATINVTG